MNPRCCVAAKLGAASLIFVSLLLLPGSGGQAWAAAPSLTQVSFSSPPVAVGGTQTCVLPGDGSVLCWGDNAVGQLGDGEVTDPTAPAGDVLAIQTVIATPAGAGGGACADLAPDGSVMGCHGGDALAGVTAIAAGFAHTCALLADTTVRCWGANAAVDGGMFSPSSSGGQLGDGTTTPHPYPVAVIAGPGQSAPLSRVTALAAASDYTCAVLTDGSAKCWGNAMQATGPAPSTVMADATHPLTGITALAAGDNATCALLTGGAVDCWGSNMEGLLGDGGTEDASSMPVAVLGAGAPSLPMSGASGLVMGHDIPVGENGIPFGHACVIDSDVTIGAVHCWGVNDSGQLGQSSSGSWLVVTGTAPLDQVTALAAGTLFSCALRADGSVQCWGGGYGTTSPNGTGSTAPVDVLPGKVVAIAAGGGFCAVFADGSLSCLDFDGGTGMVAVPGITIAAPAAAVPTPPASDPLGLTGDWNVTYGSPSTVTISYANGIYTMTAAAPVQVVRAACFLPVGTVLATFAPATTGKLIGQHGLWATVGCAFARWTPMSLVLESDGQTLTATMGNGEVHPFTRAAPASSPSPTPSPTPSPSPIPSSSPTLGPTPGPSPSAAVVASDLDHLVGDWRVTYGAPVTVALSFANGTYTVTTTTATAIAGTSCTAPAGTIMETFTGSGDKYSGQQALFGPTCQFGEWVPLTGSRDSAGAITVLNAGVPGRHVLVPVGAVAGPSLFRNSIPTPAQVNLDLATVVLPTLVAGVGIIVLVPFPGALFNSTLRTNYAELMRRGRRTRRRVRNAAMTPWFALAARLHLALGPQPIALGEEAAILTPPPAQEQRHDFWWSWPGVGVFVLLTALLSSFLDPAFWFDAASLPTFIGMLVGLVVVMVAFDLPSVIFYRRSNIRFWPRALPGTIVVALACLAISRLTDFHPGYLYGLVITVALAANLGHKVEGKLLAAGVGLALAVAIVAWFALGVVAPAAATSSDPLLVGTQTVLAMLVADGVQVAAFALLPLAFLAGESVHKWNPWVHAGLWLFGIAAFGIVILNPQDGYLSDTTRTPMLTIVALFVLFAVGSTWFWKYFRDWHKRMEALAPPAPENPQE